MGNSKSRKAPAMDDGWTIVGVPPGHTVEGPGGVDINDPLHGVKRAPDCSLEEALDTEGVRHETGMTRVRLRAARLEAMRHVETLATSDEGLGTMTKDQAAAIHLYTQETPVYLTLNRLLRIGDRDRLEPFFCYIKLFLTALHKLPACPGRYFRGVNADVADQFVVGTSLIWWQFASTTASWRTLEDPNFFEPGETRVLFDLEVRRAVNIARFSAYPREDERLVLAATPLKVVENIEGSRLGFLPEVSVVRMKEDDGCGPLIEGFKLNSVVDGARRAVAIGTKSSAGGFYMHWAVRVGKISMTWYEMQSRRNGRKRMKGGASVIAIKEGDTASSGTTGAVVIGSTTRTQDEINAFCEDWTEKHPTYSYFTINCQTFAHNFVEFLCGDNHAPLPPMEAGKKTRAVGCHFWPSIRSGGVVAKGGAIGRVEVQHGPLKAAAAGPAGSATAVSPKGKGLFGGYKASLFEAEAGIHRVASIRIRPNVDSEIGVKDGQFHLSLLGLGFSIGIRGGISVRTPLGAATILG